MGKPALSPWFLYTCTSLLLLSSLHSGLPSPTHVPSPLTFVQQGLAPPERQREGTEPVRMGFRRPHLKSSRHHSEIKI